MNRWTDGWKKLTLSAKHGLHFFLKLMNNCHFLISNDFTNTVLNLLKTQTIPGLLKTAVCFCVNTKHAWKEILKIWTIYLQKSCGISNLWFIRHLSSDYNMPRATTLESSKGSNFWIECRLKNKQKDNVHVTICIT